MISPLLTNHFLEKFSRKLKQSKKHFSTLAMNQLLSYRWPGNVRELENIIERSIVLTSGEEISEKTVKQGLDNSANKPILSLTEAKNLFEKNYVKQLLQFTSGNITDAAKLAQRNRSDFHKVIKRHNINAENYRNE